MRLEGDVGRAEATAPWPGEARGGTGDGDYVREGCDQIKKLQALAQDWEWAVRWGGECGWLPELSHATHSPWWDLRPLSLSWGHLGGPT